MKALLSEVDLRYCLRLLDGFPGQSNCALVRWRVVEEILKEKYELITQKLNIYTGFIPLSENLTLIRMLMLFVIFRATTLILF